MYLTTVDITTPEWDRERESRYEMHRTLATKLLSEPRLLYRCEGRDRLRLRTQEHVMWGHCQQEPIPPPGYELHIALTANPVVTRDGRRFGLLGRDAQMAWFHKRISAGGVDVLYVNVERSYYVETKDAAIITAVDYRALVRVNDPSQFSDLMAAGVGPSKAFGCGLILATNKGRPPDLTYK